MKNCPKCNSPIADNAESCRSCGVILSRIHTEPRPKPVLPRFSVQLDKKEVRDLDEDTFVDWCKSGRIDAGTSVFDRSAGGDWKPAGTVDTYQSNAFVVSTGDIDRRYQTIDIVTGSSQLQFSGLTAIDADRTYRVALANLIEQARGIGANGAIWIAFRTIPGQVLNLVFVVASGTAVHILPHATSAEKDDADNGR
jgi:hypothetical protein